MTAGQSEMSPEKWSASDQAAFFGQLYELMALCVRRYTGGDSTSVPKEIAQELLDGLLFVLGTPVPGANLMRQYENGLKTLTQKMETAKGLWREICLDAPDLGNLVLRDTLKEIGGFFSRHDPLFAHELRCMIDYPLCHPVSEALKGVDYITDYLKRLKTELEFINAFPVKRVRQLLEVCCMDDREQLFNLYEPLAVNALGLALIGEDPKKLDISAHERQKTADRLDADWKPAFEKAVRRVPEALGLHSVKAENYLTACVQSFLPRLKVAMESGDLSWIFLSVSEPARLSMR